jgi:hypothetical protein
LKNQAQSSNAHSSRYTRLDQLLDLDNGRIAEMDAAGTDMAIAALSGVTTQQAAAPSARDTNDQLRKVNVAKFVGPPCLPWC